MAAYQRELQTQLPCDPQKYHGLALHRADIMEIIVENVSPINKHSQHLQPPVAVSKYDVPIWRKCMLTLEEAASLFGIGINKLRDISNAKNCNFVIFVGNKRLLKREKLQAYLEEAYSI